MHIDDVHIYIVYTIFYRWTALEFSVLDTTHETFTWHLRFIGGRDHGYSGSRPDILRPVEKQGMGPA